MQTDEMWEQAINKLVSVTCSGSLEWQIDEPISSPAGAVTGHVYTSYVQGRKLAVYEFRYRYFTDEDEWELVPDVAIDFVTEDGTLEYRWPKLGPRWTLIDAIRRSVSGADEFLESFLGKKS